MKKFLRRYPFTLLCLALMMVLSFFSPPHTPLDKVAMIDKWTHLVMYGGTMAVFCIEYYRRMGTAVSRPYSLKVQALIAAVLVALGGVVELLQAYCTGGRRSGEILDWVADTLGVLLGWFLGLTLCKWCVRKIWKK